MIPALTLEAELKIHSLNHWTSRGDPIGILLFCLYLSFYFLNYENMTTHL